MRQPMPAARLLGTKEVGDPVEAGWPRTLGKEHQSYWTSVFQAVRNVAQTRRSGAPLTSFGVVRYRLVVPTTRRIGRRLLAFKWAALVFTALATVIAIRELLVVRNTSEVVSVPPHFLPVAQSTLPHPVTDSNVGAFLLLLGVIVVVQLILLAFTQLGRHHSVIPIGTEIALWIGFCFANYEMQRGYRAAVDCAGPPTHCTVTYPSVIPALILGLLIGIAIGAAWRITYRLDQRNPSSARHGASVPTLTE